MIKITTFIPVLLLLFSCHGYKDRLKKDSKNTTVESSGYVPDTSYYIRRDTIIVMDTATINGYLYSLVNDHGRAKLIVHPDRKVITGSIRFTPPARFLRYNGKVSQMSFNEVGVSSTLFIMGFTATNEESRTIQAVNTKIDTVFVTRRYAEYYKKDLDPDNFLYEQKDFVLYGYEGSLKEIESY